jgi:hypothetical protein
MYRELATAAGAFDKIAHNFGGAGCCARVDHAGVQWPRATYDHVVSALRA